MGKKLHLHLDADTSSKALYNALLERGHDVTRTPTEWMPLDATDEQQLLGATAQGRAIFTYNIRDFIVLGERYPHHAGIILARQKSMSLNELINTLDRVLREETGRLRHLHLAQVQVSTPMGLPRGEGILLISIHLFAVKLKSHPQ